MADLPKLEDVLKLAKEHNLTFHSAEGMRQPEFFMTDIIKDADKTYVSEQPVRELKYVAVGVDIGLEKGLGEITLYLPEERLEDTIPQDAIPDAIRHYITTVLKEEKYPMCEGLRPLYRHTAEVRQKEADKKAAQDLARTIPKEFPDQKTPKGPYIPIDPIDEFIQIREKFRKENKKK